MQQTQLANQGIGAGSKAYDEALRPIEQARVDAAHQGVVGAGNVAASIVMPGGSRALPSMNGTAGLQLRGVREFSADWTLPGRLVINTDGVTTKWRLDAYPGILDHDPALAAALIHRDFSRGRDDATVVVLGLTAP